MARVPTTWIEALNEHGKAVVQRVGDGVHVVCEIAHHIAVAAGIKKRRGRGLDMGNRSRRMSKSTFCAMFTIIWV